MDSSAELLAGSMLPAGPPHLDRHSSTSASASQDTSQGWFTEPSTYSEEETDFLNDVLLHQDTATNAGSALPSKCNDPVLQAATFGICATSEDGECDRVVPSPSSFSSTASIFSMPATESPLKLQLNYSDVISTWEQMTARQQTADSGPSSAQPVHDELNTISSTQYQLPYHPSCMSAPSASTLSTISQSNNAPAYPSTATSSDTAMQASMMYGHMGTAVHDPMGQRCLSLPLVQAQGWPHQTAGCQGLQERSASLERYRVQKATRPSVNLIARSQIRKVQADSKPRLQGFCANPAKLAELQLEAAMSTSFASSSPRLSGGSSASAFL